MIYTELQVTTNFSFLRGGSHPEEIVERAAELGYKAVAVTDRNTLAGIVRAHVAARENNIRFIPGCHLELLDGPDLLAYPTNKSAYSNLTGLLTEGNLRAEKGECYLYRADVFKYRTGIKFIAVPPASLKEDFTIEPAFVKALEEYKEVLGDELYLGANFSYHGDDHKKLFRLFQLGERLNIPVVASNNVYYHVPERRELQDILTCVREKCTIH
uniref:PHP domain-containing protein n=1 Tax=Mariniphaga sediminis TaxID=1628158 RepID=UPI003568074C